MITIEPILYAFRNGNPLSVALDLFIRENPDHQFAIVLKKLHYTYDHLEGFDDAISATHNIDYKIFTVEEQLVFLQFLCQLYISADRLSSARAILATIKRLISKDLPPEWQAIPFELEGSLFRVEGFHRKNMASLERCLEILGNKSGKYRVILDIYLSQLCLINEQDKFEKNLQVYKRLLENTPFTRRVDYLLVLRYVENFNLDLMISHIKKTREDNTLYFTEPDLQTCETIYELFSKNNFDILKEETTNNWLLISMAYLLKNEPKKSLFWAHKCVEDQLDYIMQSSFLSYFLVRAELANGNSNAAEYTLENKKLFDNTCLYDDFFWFRIHHMRQQHKEAQHYFNLFSANVAKYKLDRRFDVEIKLSPELSFTEINKYSKNFSAPELNSALISLQKKNKTVSESTINFIVGNSRAITLVKELAEKYATVDTSVLIVGETGTGKELVAKALWHAGPYKNKPYITINCGAISDHLLQSELFGHQKGAFTGAYQDHKGIFEEAKDGIVFLDEIGEISPSMQISLLRILEEKEYRPVGSNTTKKLKCKIIAATNRKLSDLVKKGLFREDLQYRLEKLTIETPSLKERPTDIPILIHHFLNEQNPKLTPLFFDKPTLSHLSSLPWHGNIRELRNEMERVRLFHSDKINLTIAELSEKYRTLPATLIIPLEKSNLVLKSPLNLKSKFRKLEELKALFQTNNTLSRTEVAAYLNVSPNTAANYLATLEKENFIIKTKEGSSKAHYFEKI
jgi:transcriptional regulator with PAS, ATPase and Fis domain